MTPWPSSWSRTWNEKSSWLGWSVMMMLPWFSPQASSDSVSNLKYLVTSGYTSKCNHAFKKRAAITLLEQSNLNLNLPGPLSGVRASESAVTPPASRTVSLMSRASVPFTMTCAPRPGPGISRRTGAWTWCCIASCGPNGPGRRAGPGPVSSL